jgi:hypothetical protein
MTRERLRNRRLAETFEIEVAGLKYTFDDGRIAEHVSHESQIEQCG